MDPRVYKKTKTIRQFSLGSLLLKGGKKIFPGKMQCNEWYLSPIFTHTLLCDDGHKLNFPTFLV